MKAEAVRSIAKARGIHPVKLSNIQLIKTIQTADGNFDCFATAYTGACDQSDCCWHEECFEIAKKGELS